MKKLFVGIFVCCLMLFSGVALSACGSSDREIYINFEDIGARAVVSVAGNPVETNEDGAYVVADQSNVRVEIYSTMFGVDFSNVGVTINGERNDFFADEEYEALAGDDEKFVGYFLLPRLSENVEINIFGIDAMTSTFTFEVPQEMSEDIIEKLQNVDVNLSVTEGEYVNLYTFLTGSEVKTYTRFLDNEVGTINTHNTLRVRFDVEDMFNTSQSFFKIRFEDGTERDMHSFEELNGETYVNFGDLGYDDSYTILLNFDALEYMSYSITPPEENLTFTISLESALDFQNGGTIVVDKTLQEVANYDAMMVSANDLQLEKIEDTTSQAKFAVPAGNSPSTTGGEGTFVVTVQGITYNQPTHTVGVYSEAQNYENFATMKIGDVLSNEEDVQWLGMTDDGVALTLDGRTVGVDWSYQTFADGYKTPFDLYDYDVLVGSLVTFNLEEVLSEATANFTTMEDVTTEVEDGFTLSAKFNDETGCFDSFRLTFACTRNVIVNFRNFVFVDKTVNVGFNFEDERLVSAVEYQIVSDGSTLDDSSWRALALNILEEETVQYGNIIAFRFSSSRGNAFMPEEFAIENEDLVSSYGFSTSSDSATERLILTYTISDYLWLTDSMDFVLIKV